MSFWVVAFCMSLAYAQSGTPQFIDSPSWVLAGGASSSSGQEILTVPGTNDTRPDRSVSDEDLPVSLTAGTSTVSATGSSSSGSSASADRKSSGKSPSQEGFLHIGIYFTPVINWLSSVNDPYERSGVTFSATPTLMFDMRLLGRLYFGIGAAFNTWGGKIAYPERGTVTHERSYNFSYVDIPLRIKIQTPNFAQSKGSMFFSAGANIGFGVRYHYKDIYRGFTVNTVDMGDRTGMFTLEGKMPDDTRLVNLSAVGQMGFNYQISTRLNLIIGVEYHYGFIHPLKKESGNQLENFPEYNNQQVGLILGVMF